MIGDVPRWKTWAFWRRVTAFGGAALLLVPQFFVLSDDRARLVAFLVALLNLAISFMPDEPSQTRVGQTVARWVKPG